MPTQQHLHVAVAALAAAVALTWCIRRRLTSTSTARAAGATASKARPPHGAKDLSGRSAMHGDPRFFAAKDADGLLRINTRLIDTFLRWECGRALLSMNLFPNVQEISESMACLAAVTERCDGGEAQLADPNVVAIVVGDGRAPRTAALLAMRAVGAAGGSGIVLDVGSRRAELAFVHGGAVLPGLSLELKLPPTQPPAEVGAPAERDWAALATEVVAAINSALATADPAAVASLTDALLVCGGNARNVHPHLATAIEVAADGAPRLAELRRPILPPKPEQLVLSGAQLLAAHAAVDKEERARHFVSF